MLITFTAADKFNHKCRNATISSVTQKTAKKSQIITFGVHRQSNGMGSSAWNIGDFSGC